MRRNSPRRCVNAADSEGLARRCGKGGAVHRVHRDLRTHRVRRTLLALAGIHAGKVLFWVREYEAEEGARPDYGNIGVLAGDFGAFIEYGLR